MTPKQKTWAMVLSGIVVAVAPSFFSYLQAKEEIRARAKISHAEAEAGYQTLIASVEEIRQVLVQQHDYAVRLEGYTKALEAQIATLAAEVTALRVAAPTRSGSPTRVRVAGTRAPATASGAGSPPSLPSFSVAPPPSPRFRDIPEDLEGAKAEADLTTP